MEVVGFAVVVSIDGVGVQVAVSVGSDASPVVMDSNVASSMPQAEQNLAARAICVPHSPQNLVCVWSAMFSQDSCSVGNYRKTTTNSSCRQFSARKVDQRNYGAEDEIRACDPLLGKELGVGVVLTSSRP